VNILTTLGNQIPKKPIIVKEQNLVSQPEEKLEVLESEKKEKSTKKKEPHKKKPQ